MGDLTALHCVCVCVCVCVSASGGVFHSLVVEFLGLWMADSLKILKTIARRLTLHNNITISESVDYLSTSTVFL